MERSRRWFDLLATATLVVFAGFVVVHLVCAWKLPDIRESRKPKPELQRLLEEGYEIVSELYEEPRFIKDDSTVQVFRTCKLKKGEIERFARPTERIPLAGPRRSPGSPATRIPTAQLRRLLSVGGLSDKPDCGVGQSVDNREIVFAITSPSCLVLRAADGSYASIAGAGLPPLFARLKELSTDPIADRLASVDPAVWADAVLGQTIATGISAGPAADRLVRVHREQPLRVDELIGLVMLMKGADQPAQIARAATSIPDASVQKRLLDEAAKELNEKGRRDMLAALAKREWGDAPSEVLQDAAFSALEKGDFAALEEADRNALALKIKAYADRGDAARLSKVVATQEGPAAAAAYAALRKAAGEELKDPAEAADLPRARAWVDAFKKAHADWFP